MKNIKQIKKYGSFTQEDLDIVESLLNKEAHPQFYKKNDSTSYSLPEGIEYDCLTLMGEKGVTREGTIGSSQSIRSGGGNPKRDSLARDIMENGWKLFCDPISVIQIGSKIVILDGRTKDKILQDVKYTNRIVRLYKFVGEHANNPDLQEDAIEDFGLEGNEEPYVAGYNLQEDFFEIAKNKVERGTLEATESSILGWINKRARSFSKQKREDIATRVFHDVNNTNAGLKVESWTQDEAEVWLIKNNYLSVGNIVYLVVSSGYASKALFSACKLAQENPGKEIRVVLHTGTLTGWDRSASYVKSIKKFKTEWYLKLSQMSFGFFKGTRFTDSPIKLYGVLPSNIINLCEDDGKLIVFGKNDQKIENFNQNRISSALSRYLEVEDEDEEEEVAA
jgi:hypothetical protein